MKRLLSIFIITLLIMNTSLFAFAAPVVTPDPKLEEFVDALWQFQGNSKTVLTEMLDVYFQLKPENRAGFITSYEKALGALGGFGNTLVGFGLSAEMFVKLNDHGSDSNVYQAYIGNDKAVFKNAVYNAKETILGYAFLDKMIDGLNKVDESKVVQLYYDAHLFAYFNVLGYNPTTKNIDKMIRPNIETLYEFKKDYLTKKNVDALKVENSLAELKNFYNDITDSGDKTKVYNHYVDQNMILHLATLSPMTTTSTSASGTGQLDLYVRIMAGATQLGEALIPRKGPINFDVTIPAQIVGTVVKAQILSYGYDPSSSNAYSILDETSIIVTQAVVVVPPVVVPPGGGGGGGGGGVAPAPAAQVVTIPEDLLALAGLSFDDVAGVPWALEAIVRLQEKGIIRGKGPRIFDPNGSITRAEFAAMATRLFAYEATEADKMNFGDVKATDWFFKEVKAAYIKGIIKGLGESFNPYGNITRQEIATIIGRILSLNAFTLKDVTVLNIFEDAKQISIWAVSGSQLTVQEKIMSGRTATTFAPKESATRAEIAVTLYRMKDKVKTILQ